MDQKNTKNLASNLLSIGFLTKTPSPQAKRISSQLLSYLHTNHKKENKHLNHRPPKETTCSKKRDSDLWAKCFLELANEFLQKKEQLLKLNPSRRKLLREHLIKLSKTKQKPSLQSFVQSTPSDPLYKGLQAFSWEISIFYIFEFLLLKRWVAQGRVDKMPENPSGLNWKIHSHLKEKNRKQVLQQTQWQFLKINIYSWYQLGRGSWLKLENLARKTDISQKSADFLYEILLKERAIFKKIGIDCKHEYTKLAWELLLKQRQLDERVPVQQFPSIHRQSSSIIAGLCGGQALSSLQSIAHTYSLPSQIYALANTNLEIFLGEIIYLWNSNTKDLKTLKIELVEKNKKQKEKEIETLFSSPKQSILNEVHSVNHISIFLEDKKKTNLKIRKIPSLIRYLSNHGLILLVGEEYWPLAENRKSEKIRKFILNNTSIRFIVDLQQLITKQRSQTLPQCICVLEKNNSKELRDKNRPLIIKVKGNIEQQDDLQKFREKILECLEAPPAPCKTQSHSIPLHKNAVRGNICCYNTRTFRAEPMDTSYRSKFLPRCKPIK